MRLPAPRCAIAGIVLAASAAIVCAAERLHAQSPGAAVDERMRPVSYDLVVRFEGAHWEGILIVFPDSAIVLPKLGSCKEMDRTRRRVSASQESWPCDGPSGLQDFQIIVDRQNHKFSSWKGAAQRPYEKTTNACAMTRTDASGKEVCMQYEKLTEYKATTVSGRVDLVARTLARP